MTSEETKAQLLLAVARADNEELRIELGEYNSHPYVNCRVWFKPDSGGKFLPTKKGVTFRRLELPKVLCALQEAARRLAEELPE